MRQKSFFRRSSAWLYALFASIARTHAFPCAFAYEKNFAPGAKIHCGRERDFPILVWPKGDFEIESENNFDDLRSLFSSLSVHTEEKNGDKFANRRFFVAIPNLVGIFDAKLSFCLIT